MRRPSGYLSAVALLTLLASCSGQANGTQRAAPSASATPVELQEVVSTVQHHQGRVSLELDFSGSSISETALLEVPGLECATAVNFTGVALTDAGLSEIVARMPELRRIDLSGTQVSDAGLEHLKRLPKLEYVSYHNGQISRTALLRLVQFLAQRGPASAER